VITFRQRIGLATVVGVGVLLAVCGGATDRGGSLERALDLLDQGVIFEAIHELELFVEDNPDHEAARMELARTLHRVKRDRRTAEEAANVLRINPNNAEARRLLTRIRIKLGRDLDRTDPAAVLDYARLCSRPETYGRAADFYRLYLDLDDDPLVHMEFGKMLYWAERYEEARKHLETYLDYKPDDVDIRRQLGRILAALGDFESAVEQYRLCLEGRPNDMDTQLDLARALMWNGQETEAETMLKEINRRSAEYDTPLILLASIARIQGRVQREYELYKAVLEANPENAEARKRVDELEQGNHLPIAICLDRLNDYPEDTDTRRKLIELLFSEERYGESIPHLHELNMMIPYDADTLAKLRFAREEEGRRAMVQVDAFQERKAEERGKEITGLETWLRDNPNDFRGRVTLADLLMDNRDYVAAIAHLEILESMMPSDGRITEKLHRAQMLMRDIVSAEATPEE
jgi:tetratricopeptide (TPR) repeat protein